MALSAEERLYVFTILGIPVNKPEDFYQDHSSKQTVNRELLLWRDQFRYLDYPYEYSDDIVKAIDAKIVSLTVTEIDRVQTIITEWQAIEFNTVKVKTTQVEVNYDRQRYHLKSLLKIIFPVNLVGGISQGNPNVSIG